MDRRPGQGVNGPGVIGVVGAGTMGAGIAQLALEAGARVVIHDPDPSAVERARDRIADGIARRSTKRIADRLSRSGGPSPRRSSRLEDGDRPRAAGGGGRRRHRGGARGPRPEAAASSSPRLDAAARPGTILATNTSALSVGAIAAATGHPERVVGLHFFNPAPVMALVEVVAPPAADPAVVRRATELVAGWGKTAVRSADSPGFIVNRVNRPFTLEALALLEAGLGSVESIDARVRAAGYPMGPFELMDLIGIDVNLAAARGIYQAFRYEPRFRPSPIQERLVEAGRLGRKTREGFYWYGDDGRSLGQAGAFASDPEAAADATTGSWRCPARVPAMTRPRPTRHVRSGRRADRPGHRQRGLPRPRRRGRQRRRHRPRAAPGGRSPCRTVRAHGRARRTGRGRRPAGAVALGRPSLRPGANARRGRPRTGCPQVRAATAVARPGRDRAACRHHAPDPSSPPCRRRPPGDPVLPSIHYPEAADRGRRLRPGRPAGSLRRADGHASSSVAPPSPGAQRRPSKARLRVRPAAPRRVAPRPAPRRRSTRTPCPSSRRFCRPPLAAWCSSA